MTKITSVLYLSVFALIGALCVSSVSAQTLSASAQSSTGKCVSLTRQIRKGMQNSDVRSLQQFLILKGLLSAEATGYFGNLTADAVIKFQAMNGLEQVGSVGPRTLGLINQMVVQGCKEISGNASVSAAANGGRPVADSATNAHLANGMRLAGITAEKLNQPTTCVTGTLKGDLNNDTKVDMWDLVVLSRNYDLPAGQLIDPSADKNGNNDVDFSELLWVAQDFGKSTNCTTGTTAVGQTGQNATTNANTSTDSQQSAVAKGAILAGVSPTSGNTLTCSNDYIWPGDLNEDNKVDMWDLAILGTNYDLPAGQLINPRADKNNNQDVDFYEALMVSRHIGKKACAPTPATTNSNSNANRPVYNTATYVTTDNETNTQNSNTTATANTTSGVNTSVGTGASMPSASEQTVISGYASQFGINQGTLYAAATCSTSADFSQGDLNDDGYVNWWDLMLVGRNYNRPAGTLVDPSADQNGDGVVNFYELLKVSQHFGKKTAGCTAASSAN